MCLSLEVDPKIIDIQNIRNVIQRAPQLSSVCLLSTFPHVSHSDLNSALSDLCRCPRLRSIVLAGVHELSDRTVCRIVAACSPNLTHLSLGTAPTLTSKSIEGIARHCPSLTHLELLCVSRLVSDASLITLFKSAPSLRALHLSSGINSDDILPPLATHCTSLSALTLRRFHLLSDPGLAHLLHRLPSLTHLELSRCFHASTSTLTAILALRHLTHLDISLTSCPLSLLPILKASPSLSSLLLSSLSLLPDSNSDLVHLATHRRSDLRSNSDPDSTHDPPSPPASPALTSLDLSHVLHVSDSGLSAVFPLTPSLLHLSLSGLPHSSLSHSLLSLADHCPHLLTLSLASCTGATDPLVAQVVKRCPALLSLALDHTYVTDHLVGVLCTYAQSLQRLSIDGCANITAFGRRLLAQCLPAVQVSMESLNTHSA